MEVVPAGLGNLTAPASIFVAIPWFLICLLRGKGWQVQVRTSGKPPKQRGWRLVPHVAVVAEARTKAVAQDEARRTVDMIAKHGWKEGITYRWA